MSTLTLNRNEENPCPERRRHQDAETSYCLFTSGYCLLDREGGKCSYYDDYLREVRESEEVTE